VPKHKILHSAGKMHRKHGGALLSREDALEGDQLRRAGIEITQVHAGSGMHARRVQCRDSMSLLPGS